MEKDQGCNGGEEDDAFDYAKTNGVMLESDYPYTAKTGKTCKYAEAKAQVKVTDYKKIVPKSVEAMKASIQVGPTCIGVAASNDYFQFYEHGIIDSLKCPNTLKDLDHAVTAIGYGKEGTQEYLIIRNSWSIYWGEKGYVRVAIDKDGPGICGILLDSSRPSTAKAQQELLGGLY